MSSSRSNFHTSSPSFPSVQQVSGDIFFQVKKQILDKLDIILQKVNLEVIDYLKPEDERKQDKKAFRFIEMSSFEKEIQTLFDYLDRLYQSLNSSISFSSNDIKNTLNNTESNKNKHQSINQYNSVLESEITSIKIKLQQLGEDNVRLREENQHMRFLLKNNFNNSLSLTHSINQDSKTSLKNNQNQHASNNFGKSTQSPQVQKLQGLPLTKGNYIKSSTPLMQGISLETVKKILRFYNHSIRQLSIQYKQNVKEIKKTLKQVKFQAIQNRVQCIAQLKKWTESQNQSKQSQTSNKKQNTTNSNVSLIDRNNSVQQLNNQQLNQAICSQDCLQKYYLQRGEQNGFEEDLLQKIQQILDVC